MNFKDSPNHYGFISRFNHWLGALIIIGMLAVGLYFSEMPRGDEKSYWLKLHIGVGGLVFLFLWFRVFWRVFTKSPAPFKQKQSLQLITQVVHWVLLLSVLTMAISGPLLIWSNGYAINVFDWFAIPSPLEKMPDLHELMEEVHEVTSKVLLGAVILHFLAAIKHRIIDKDDLMPRMIKFLRK